MGHIIRSVMSVCLSVCKHSYGRNYFFDFDVFFSTVVRVLESKIEYVCGKNSITLYSILPQFRPNFYPCNAFQRNGFSTTARTPKAL